MYLLAACVGAVVLIGVWRYMGREDRREADKNSVRIEVLLCRGGNTFIGTLCTDLEDKAKEYEQETGIEVKLDVMNAKGSRGTQSSQVERLIPLGCDALCINSVDRSLASIIIDKIMSAGTPAVFFSREPVREDTNRWEKLYYVGVDAKGSAVLQGDTPVDAYNQDTRTPGVSGNDLASCVLLEGETSHQDSLIHMEQPIQTLKDRGVPLEKTTGRIVDQDRSQASALMEQWLKEYLGQIGLTVNDNDDVVLGAIDATSRAGIGTNSIKVMGIGGTPVGIKALEEGYLFGTMESDKERYSQAIFDIAWSLSLGQGPKDRVPQLEGNHHWCPQRVLVQIEVELLKNQRFVSETPVKRDKIEEIL